MAQARPATITLPTIQKVANTLSAPPRLRLGWNSAKYVHTSGMLPPTLKWRMENNLYDININVIPEAADESEQQEGGVVPAGRRDGPEQRVDKHCDDESGPPAVNVAFTPFNLFTVGK